MSVTEGGMIEAGMITGEAAIMARYLGHIAVCVAAVPMPGEVRPKSTPHFLAEISSTNLSGTNCRD